MAYTKLSSVITVSYLIPGRHGRACCPKFRALPHSPPPPLPQGAQQLIAPSWGSDSSRGTPPLQHLWSTSCLLFLFLPCLLSSCDFCLKPSTSRFCISESGCRCVLPFKVTFNSKWLFSFNHMSYSLSVLLPQRYSQWPHGFPKFKLQFSAISEISNQLFYLVWHFWCL